MSSRREWFAWGACAVILGVAVGGSLLPQLGRPSNCGGNSAALTYCRMFVLEIRAQISDAGGLAFDLAEADQAIRARLRRLGENPWLGSARLLARLKEVRIDPAAPRLVILVCDTPFDNVPRRWLWRASPTHAVAYSTGEVSLISPGEYAKLDLTGFTDLRSLKVGEIGKVASPTDNPATAFGDSAAREGLPR